MKVLLINPPREVPQPPDFPPIGLAYIAAVLKQNGIEVNVLDTSSFSWKRLGKVVKKKNPAIVGIPCWTLEREQSFKTA
ncbi:MAG: B12-binding domain-containing radical SAM protein, partial [Deltaproteobacteria bacterium CG07_land_8_20_14_0_80_38_7]